MAGVEVGVYLPSTSNNNLCLWEALQTGYSFSTYSISGSVPGISLPRWLSGKKSACQCRRHRRCGFDPWIGKLPPREVNGNSLHVLSWEVLGQRRLVGYCPWGCKKLDMTEHACMHAPRIKDKLVTKAGKNRCSGGADSLTLIWILVTLNIPHIKYTELREWKSFEWLL